VLHFKVPGHDIFKYALGWNLELCMQIESSSLEEIISNKVAVLESKARIASILVVFMLVCWKHGIVFEKDYQEEVILYVVVLP
jgi:hypothetical protein